MRTVEYQKRLMRTNHNAAEAEGDIVSPHLTGATIDIAKSGLSKKEMLWMRNQLLNYQNAGVLDVEEEFRQRCFHITVYKNYAPGAPIGPRKSPNGALQRLIADLSPLHIPRRISPTNNPPSTRSVPQISFLICTGRATISCERNSSGRWFWTRLRGECEAHWWSSPHSATIPETDFN